MGNSNGNCGLVESVFVFLTVTWIVHLLLTRLIIVLVPYLEDAPVQYECTVFNIALCLCFGEFAKDQILFSI